MELFDNITDKTKFANYYSLPECFREESPYYKKCHLVRRRSNPFAHACSHNTKYTPP